MYLDLHKKSTTYIPEKNEFVIGIIKMKIGESYVVDINSPLDGSFGILEFDGATKRNRPNLSQGDLVYVRIVDYNKYMGASLSCINKGFSTKKVLG